MIAGIEMAIESWGPEKSEEDSVGTLELVSIVYKEKIYSRYGKKCCKIMSKKLLKKFKWYKGRSVRMLWEIGKECCYPQPPLKGLWIIDESYCILNIPGTTLNVVYAFSCLTLTAAPWGILIPNLHLCKLKCREIQELANILSQWLGKAESIGSFVLQNLQM